MKPPRTGRPRLEQRSDTDSSPDQEILVAASRLFAQKGFASTTTREIAAAVGMQQPSLFYWFPTKWAILNKLIEFGIAESARKALDLRALEGRAIVRLYALLWFDALRLCSSPYDLSFLTGAPELRDERLTYRPHLTALQQVVEELVGLAIGDGDVEPIDVRLARMVVLDLNGSVVRWDLGGDPEATAIEVVRLAIRAIAADDLDIAQVAAEAQALLKP